MTAGGCRKAGKKHTPITSEAEQGFFGAELGRLRKGKRRKTKMTEEQLVSHVKESRGKRLPAYAHGSNWRKALGDVG